MRKLVKKTLHVCQSYGTVQPMLILALFLLPLVSGFVATIAAFVIAAFIARAAEGAYVPEATPGETAEWIASFDAIDVDAEWIALASVCPDCGMSPEECAAEVCGWIGASTDIDAFRSFAREVRGDVEGMARDALASARKRIVGKMQRAEATTGEDAKPVDGRKLVSYSARIREACDRIRARNEENAYLARLAIEHTFAIAADRAWREAYASPVEFDAEAVRDAGLYALTSIACLLGDDTEAAIAWRTMQEAADAVRDAFEAECDHAWRYAADFRQCRACDAVQSCHEYTEAEETAATIAAYAAA